MGKPKEEVEYEKSMEEIETEEQIEQEIYLNTRKFNSDTNVIDLGHQPSTDMKTSRRVVFPPARPTKEEATMEVRLAMWKEEISTYVTANCGKNRVQKTQQLSKAQER